MNTYLSIFVNKLYLKSFILTALKPLFSRIHCLLSYSLTVEDVESLLIYFI